MRDSDFFRNASEPLSEQQAWAVIRPMWLKTKEAFERKGYAEPSKVLAIEIDPKWHDSCRHFAAASSDGTRLFFAPEMADLPSETVLAIMAHEAGHVVDLSNPGRFWYRPARSVPMREGGRAVSVFDVPQDFAEATLFAFTKLPEKNLRKHLAQWHERGHDEVENVADKIAEFVIERKIGYVGPEGCLLQTFDRGVKRPAALR